MIILNDIRFILKLKKNLISPVTLLTNGFSQKSDGDNDIIKVRKSALIMMRACNIYKLLENIDVHDVASVKSNNDATKL